MKLSRALYLRMLARAVHERPNECVGILAGPEGGEPCHIFYATNIAKDPTNTYQLDPQEQLGIEQAIAGAGLVPVAIYHSHPSSRAWPSDLDKLTALNPQPVIIIGIKDLPDWVEMRAFNLRSGVEPLPLELV